MLALIARAIEMGYLFRRTRQKRERIPPALHEGRLIGKGTVGKKRFYDDDYKAVAEAHSSVLQQLAILELYIDEKHKNEIRACNPRRSATWISKEQKHKFPELLKDQNLSFGESLEEKNIAEAGKWPNLPRDLMASIVEKEKIGEFVARREHDELTAALGTAEHSGRVRGKSSRTSWNVGFPKESKSYKKRDTYNTKLREKKVTQQVTQQFYRLAAQHPQAFPYLTPQAEQTVQIPSSIGSIETTSYSVDLITGPTPCNLVVPIGKA
uniref:Retroelement n=2 Tax=Oryza sativa subsp. japonica TaxID=39947 RepID=Q7G2V7_ORYSJ|nr:Putative retroelement [Oryza sativa Japonica Group]AAP53631.1 transposon protein, putative, CACTA, En/Spm sub-class [Oryza sativa Japonica Group]